MSLVDNQGLHGRSTAEIVAIAPGSSLEINTALVRARLLARDKLTLAAFDAWEAAVY